MYPKLAGASEGYVLIFQNILYMFKEKKMTPVFFELYWILLGNDVMW